MSETQVIENAKGALKNAERILQPANEQLALLSTSPKAKGVEQITQPATVPASAGKVVNKGAAKSRPLPPPNVKKLLKERMKAIGKPRSINGVYLNQTGFKVASYGTRWNQDAVYGRRPF